MRLLSLIPLLLLASPGASEDPDGGLARAYFRGLELQPMHRVASRQKARDIVWIVVDALRPDHLGAYGYQRPTSPFLTEASRDAFVFVNAYTNAPWTRPATTSMLTGLFASEHRTQTEQSKLPPEIRTVAQDLKALGYQTAAVVANGNASSIAELDRGFDFYLDPANHFGKLPVAAQVYDAALGWLREKRDPSRPFFLFVFLVDPHDPYRAPPEYEKQFLPKGFEGEPRRRAHWEYKNDYPKAERESMIAIYDAAIRYTDDQTRRFFDALSALGLRDGLTWLLTADHGEGFGEHGYYLHAYHFYDEFVRVPLILHTPAWSGGGHVFHLVEHVDLLPTLVTLAGGKPRAKLPGQDIGAMLARPPDLDRRLLSEYRSFGISRSSIFDLRHRVILQLPADKKVFLKHIPRTELLPSVSFDREVLQVFDRVADPLDHHPLEKVPDRVKPMIRELREHMAAGTARPETKMDRVPPGVEENLRSLGYVQ